MRYVNIDIKYYFFFLQILPHIFNIETNAKKIPLFPKHNLKNDNDIINDIFSRYIKEESSLFSY